MSSDVLLDPTPARANDYGVDPSGLLDRQMNHYVIIGEIDR
jgi:hypothetical protein